jgi:hypothetical protein
LVKRISIATALFLIALTLVASGKSLMRQRGVSASFTASLASKTGLTAALRTFESTLTPYLRARANHAVIPLSTYIPRQADYYFLAKHWSQLSTNFLDLYTAAVQIPPGLKTYVSPGGHFQIVYSDSGIDAVDLTDTIGYSSANWRVKMHGGNGVPDYVEYVAYAADSAWSMEIDGFGFVKPYPYIGNGYTSPQFRIYVRNFSGEDESDYGETFPDSKESSGIGYESHIEIRNEWNEYFWDIPPMDYGTHPEKAIQVTCVHEFFHTIQYAMTRQLSDSYVPADFPVSWIEGTAVNMEDRGFNYVHDYLQYLDPFFSDPTAEVLEPVDSDISVYKNSIVAIFLFQQTADTPCICFIKSMFFNDYQKPIAFLNNLRASALQFGHAWTDLLGNFFTQSYYTGSRSVNGRFIKDAALLPQWDYAPDAVTDAQPIRKTIQPFAMNTFSFLHQAGDADALKIGFLGDSLNTGETDTNTIWSVHCILKKDTVSADDSVFAMPIATLSHGSAAIDGWHRFTEALVVVTNGRYDLSRSATVTFEACGTTVRAGDSASFSAAGGSQASSNGPRATISVKATADLLCTLSITATSIGRQMVDAAASARLTPVGAFFNLSFPITWSFDASMKLTIDEPLDSIRSKLDSTLAPDSMAFLYRWDNSLLQWQLCPGTVGHLPDSTFVFSSPVTTAGIFGLFGRQQDTTSALYVYPNPARLRSNGAIIFKSKEARDSLLEIWIYSMDGSLLVHGTANGRIDPSLSRTQYGFSWKLQSNRGKPVSPGVYYAYLGYTDPLTTGLKKKAQKLFVIP